MKHESCDFHKQAVMATNKVEVGEMFLAEHAKEKSNHLLKLLSTVCLSCSPSATFKGEKDSNFYQLLLLCRKMVLASNQCCKEHIYIFPV